MKIITKPQEMQEQIISLKKEGKTIGFVPTMGALHEGHLSLVREARKQNSIVVVSIFVNPIQFGPQEDFDRYPRPFEKDKQLLEKEKVDYLFYPDYREIYPADYSTYILVENPFTEKLCGAKRPGHFRGVATVVGMLFHICLPDKAYFGLKDYQQVLVIQKMVTDLRFPVTIVPMPIYREEDGLAMSSRNQYLTPEERKKAPILYKTLLEIEQKIHSGITNSETLLIEAKRKIESVEGTRIDYIEIVDYQTLEPIKQIQKNQTVLIALAVFFGKTRLIDNLLVKV